MTNTPLPTRVRAIQPVRFGRYTLLTTLTTGATGEVFLARLEGAHGFDKLCVIKRIFEHLADETEFVERFVDEARVLVKLSHGNIAQVLDVGVNEGVPFIALDFVDGKSLRRVAERTKERALPLPTSLVLYTMIRVLDALGYAHRKRDDHDRELNIVHRDVSLQNVLISYEGEIKIIDFGLAKSALSQSKTQPGVVLGTYFYMSPEHARRERVDKRSDLYAVGICLYELIAGKNPLEGAATTDIVEMVTNPSFPPLSQVEPLCPPALSEVVAKAMSVNPADRFQTADEFRNRLQTLLAELDPAIGPESVSRFMRDAFADEYLQERKHLAELKTAVAPDKQVAAETAVTEALGERTTPTATTQTQLQPMLVDPTPVRDRTPVEPLSFAPTPRRSSEDAAFRPSGDVEGDTAPAASAPTSRSAPTLRYIPPHVVTPIPAAPQHDASVPSIMLEGVEAEPDAPAAPVRSNRLKDMRVFSPDRDDDQGPMLPAALEAKVSAATKRKKKKQKAISEPDLRPMPITAPPTVKRMVAEPPAVQGGFSKWFLLPIVAAVLVIAFIVWDQLK